jgi:hypothetical protein
VIDGHSLCRETGRVRQRASARVAGLGQEIREEAALGERLRGVLMAIARPRRDKASERPADGLLPW